MPFTTNRSFNLTAVTHTQQNPFADAKLIFWFRQIISFEVGVKPKVKIRVQDRKMVIFGFARYSQQLFCYVYHK